MKKLITGISCILILAVFFSLNVFATVYKETETQTNFLVDYYKYRNDHAFKMFYNAYVYPNEETWASNEVSVTTDSTGYARITIYKPDGKSVMDTGNEYIDGFFKTPAVFIGMLPAQKINHYGRRLLPGQGVNDTWNITIT